METRTITLPEEHLLPELHKYVFEIDGEYHFRNFLYWSYFPVDLFNPCSSNTMVNEGYTLKKKMYDQYFKKKKYHDIFNLLDKHNRMEWFIDNYELLYEDLGERKYYKFLRENLVYVDNHDPYRKFYSQLIQIGSDPTLMMSSNEKREFKKLPNELTIFRGTSSDKKITKRNVKSLFGNSWSIDREISIWFSLKHSPKFRGSKHIILLTYTLPKKEVISYFTDRKENEIFLDYTTIDLNRIDIEEIPKNYKLKVNFNTGK